MCWGQFPIPYIGQIFTGRFDYSPVANEVVLTAEPKSMQLGKSTIFQSRGVSSLNY